jgi:hypothetical protein
LLDFRLFLSLFCGLRATDKKATIASETSSLGDRFPGFTAGNVIAIPVDFNPAKINDPG